jgi:DNA-binding beta-propeller fold protein YncE
MAAVGARHLHRLQGNVWFGGGGARDAQVLKFTQDGKFLLQIGHLGKNGNSNDTNNLGAPTDCQVDPVPNEVYVSDGYGNHRVIVFDADSGSYKRLWGAYGQKPDDSGLPYFSTPGWPFKYDPNAPPARQFNIVHCAVRLRPD